MAEGYFNKIDLVTCLSIAVILIGPFISPCNSAPTKTTDQLLSRTSRSTPSQKELHFFNKNLGHQIHRLNALYKHVKLATTTKTTLNWLNNNVLQKLKPEPGEKLNVLHKTLQIFLHHIDALARVKFDPKGKFDKKNRTSIYITTKALLRSFKGEVELSIMKINGGKIPRKAKLLETLPKPKSAMSLSEIEMTDLTFFSTMKNFFKTSVKTYLHHKKSPNSTLK